MTGAKVFLILAFGLLAVTNLTCAQEEEEPPPPPPPSDDGGQQNNGENPPEGGGGENQNQATTEQPPPAGDGENQEQPSPDGGSDGQNQATTEQPPPAGDGENQEQPSPDGGSDGQNQATTEQPPQEGASEGSNQENQGNQDQSASDAAKVTDPKYTTDPDSCPQEVFVNNEDRNKCCTLLNEKRANFFDCCEYPRLVIWRWQFDLCWEQFSVEGKDPGRCELASCCLQYIGAIDDEVTTVGCKQEGMEISFKRSVENNTAWDMPIHNAVSRCFSMNHKPPPTDKTSKEYMDYWDCFETIPRNMGIIMDCTYDYNFFWCPQGIFQEDHPGCQLAKQYVFDCFISNFGQSG